MGKSLYIDNFKGFSNFETDGFSGINLLYGFNNSGKTSILEAIGFGLNPKYMATRGYLNKYPSQSPIDDWFNQSVSIVINNEEAQLNLNFYEEKFLFPVKDKDQEIPITIRLKSLLCNGNPIILGYDIPKQNYLPAREFIEKEEAKGAISKFILDSKIVEFAQRILAKRESPQIYAPIHFFADTNYQQKKLVDEVLENQALKNRVLQVIKQIDPSIVDYFFNAEGKLRFKVNDNESSRPVEYMGDGLKKIFNLLNVLLASGAKTVLIDELDNGLHPNTYSKIFAILRELCESENVQFFITSHNPELVKNLADYSIKNQIKEQVRFFNVLKNDEGKHWCSVHAPEQMHKLLSNNYNQKLRW